MTKASYLPTFPTEGNSGVESTSKISKIVNRK
jgi:hypothetical protein